jgi:hypothetical protein
VLRGIEREHLIAPVWNLAGANIWDLGTPDPKLNPLWSSPSWCHEVFDVSYLIMDILNVAGYGQGTPSSTGLELFRSEHMIPGDPKHKVEPALMESKLVPPGPWWKLFNYAHIECCGAWRGSTLLHRFGTFQERIYDTWEAQTQSSTRSDQVRAGATRFLMKTV